MLPLSLERRREDAFSEWLASHAVDDVPIAHGRCPSHRVDRTKANIARGRETFFYLISPVAGAVRVEQFGRLTLAEAGECGLTVSDEPFRLDFVTDANSMTAQIPVNLLLSGWACARDATAVNLSKVTASGCALAASERTVHLAMKAVGDSFMGYVRRRRLDRVALDLSSEGDANLRIARIAQDWGFSDLSPFNRAFRERFQMAPREFRACR